VGPATCEARSSAIYKSNTACYGQSGPGAPRWHQDYNLLRKCLVSKGGGQSTSFFNVCLAYSSMAEF